MVEQVELSRGHLAAAQTGQDITVDPQDSAIRAQPAGVSPVLDQGANRIDRQPLSPAYGAELAVVKAEEALVQQAHPQTAVRAQRQSGHAASRQVCHDLRTVGLLEIDLEQPVRRSNPERSGTAILHDGPHTEIGDGGAQRPVSAPLTFNYP